MPTRNDAIALATDYLDSGDFEADLARRVAIPSESQTPEGLPHCARYLDEEMVPAFKAMGFDCQTFDNPIAGCGPILLATRFEADGLPTILGYGHGDVIRGLDDQWTKGAGPWQTARDGDRLYGRGTADNKGQHASRPARRTGRPVCARSSRPTWRHSAQTPSSPPTAQGCEPTGPPSVWARAAARTFPWSAICATAGTIPATGAGRWPTRRRSWHMRSPPSSARRGRYWSRNGCRPPSPTPCAMR
jgi:hypothetical protein